MNKKVLVCTTVSGTIKAFLTPHIKLLESHSYDVSILTKIISFEDIPPKSEVYSVGLSRFPLSPMNFLAFFRILKILKNNTYDLIITHTPNISLIIRLANFLTSKSKLIYFVHGFHFHKKSNVISWIMWFPLEFLFSKLTDVYITINKEDYLICTQKFKVKTTLINGVGIEMPENNHHESDKFMSDKDNKMFILAIGELNRNKNHKLLLEAISLLKRDDFILMIFGRGKKETMLRRLIKKRNLSDRVKLMGFSTDIKFFIKESTMIVNTSYREGLPVSVLEAMSYGKPVVATDIRGNKDLIDHDYGGFLYEINSNSKFLLSEYINEILNNQNIRMRFGQYNIKKVEKYLFKNIEKDLIEALSL